ncbi:ABC-2 family transporter protein [Pseudomonas silvicola]|nr:ABC-2 family transporter protein [Pseudomonas silvicola]
MFKWIWNCLQSELKYLTNLTGHVAALCVFYSCQLIFFDVVSNFLGGAVSKSWLFIMLLSYVVVSLVVNFFSASIESFFQHLSRGLGDPFLIKPVPMWWLVLLRQCKPSYLYVLVCVCIIVCVYADLALLVHPAAGLVLWVLSLVVGVVANLSFLIMFYSLTFLTQREMPVDYVHSELSAFAIVPVPFFSTIITKLLIHAFPLLVSASVSANVLDKGDVGLFFEFLFIVFVHACASVLLFRSLARRFDGLGG